jgi:hypothetical protein
MRVNLKECIGVGQWSHRWKQIRKIINIGSGTAFRTCRTYSLCRVESGVIDHPALARAPWERRYNCELCCSLGTLSEKPDERIRVESRFISRPQDRDRDIVGAVASTSDMTLSQVNALPRGTSCIKGEEMKYAETGRLVVLFLSILFSRIGHFSNS